ncbi:MAG TPA: hypothetical protein VMG41_10180, partial [Gemmatimonadales bacterium]|nr:hypothetical protein [Gemmatimonadales bacterium]
MTFRPVLVAALCLGSLAASQRPDGSPKRYRVDLKTSVTQDLTAIGQGPQKQAFANTAFVTLTSHDSAGGQAVILVLDSLLPGEGSPLPPDSAKAASGVTWRGFRAQSGRVNNLQTESESMMVGAIEPALEQLFPPMRAGTGAGQSWTDTTDANNNGVAIRTVTNFLTASDSVGGMKVIRLAGAFSSAMSGEQQGPQGTLNIDGTGTGMTTWVVAGDGTCLSSKHSA